MPKTPRPLVYVDSCVYLNVIKREKGLWSDSLKVLLAAERGDIRLAASTLVAAELLGWKGDVDPSSAGAAVERYLMEVDTQWVELDLMTARSVSQIAGQYKLRGPDAVHLASALRVKAEYFMTRDIRFPIGAAVDSTTIVFPTVVWDPTLEDLQVDQAAS